MTAVESTESAESAGPVESAGVIESSGSVDVTAAAEVERAVDETIVEPTLGKECADEAPEIKGREGAKGKCGSIIVNF